MAGHGEKLTRKQELAIAALLTEPTVESAAAKAGIPYRTLKHWLGTRPDFVAAYREARRQVVEFAVAAVQEAATEALATLTRNLNCGVPAAENTAARVILEQALRGVELFDLATALEDMKRQLSESQQDEQRRFWAPPPPAEPGASPGPQGCAPDQPEPPADEPFIPLFR